MLDRTYTGKGFAGLLGNAATGRWGPGDEVVFVHTGGLPAVFADAAEPPVVSAPDVSAISPDREPGRR